MAQTKVKPSPPQDQQTRLNALLAELMPAAPKGLSLAPEWHPEAESWTLWVTDGEVANWR